MERKGCKSTSQNRVLFAVAGGVWLRAGSQGAQRLREAQKAQEAQGGPGNPGRPREVQGGPRRCGEAEGGPGRTLSPRKMSRTIDELI